MSFNYSILSYNKIEEIDEKEPIPTPTFYSSYEEEKNEENLKFYYSFYLNHNFKIEANNTNNNRSYSTPSLMLITNKNKIDNKEKKKNDSNDSQENIGNIIKLKNNNNKSNDLKEKKNLKLKSYKEKMIYNIKGKKYIDNTKQKKTSNKKQNMINKSKSRNKKDNCLKNGDSTISNITIKNENTKHRVEFDNKSQNINVYINNNIYNFKISNRNQSTNESFQKNISIENKVKNYTNKKNLKFPKKDKEEIAKKKIIQNYIFSMQNNKPNNPNDHANSNLKTNKKYSNGKNTNKIDIINNHHKNKIKDINFSNINNDTPKTINSNENTNKNLKNIDNNTLSNNSVISSITNNLITNGNIISKIGSLKINQIKKIVPKNGLFNIISFLDSKDINSIIESRNKKLILLINKSIFDAYHLNIKQHLEKYKEFLDILKYSLVYSKVKDLLRIDLTITIRFIDKNNKISALNPKHFQLIYLYEYLKTKKSTNDKLYDVYSFDLYCNKKEIETRINKEFNGIYLSKQISIISIDKNDEIINIQPILPFKIDDKGIFNLEIFSKNNFVNPNNLKIKLQYKDLYKNIKELKNKNIDNIRINEYEYICKYWKRVKYDYKNVNEILKEKIAKSLQTVKNIVKKWFNPYFIIKDIFYDNIGLSVYKFHLVANECGMLINNNLNMKIIVKDNGDYVENEIKKNNLLFEKRGIFEVRKGENIIFYLAMNENI